MLKKKVESLEKKYANDPRVCIVLPGETRKDAIDRLKLNSIDRRSIVFLKIVGV